MSNPTWRRKRRHWRTIGIALVGISGLGLVFTNLPAFYHVPATVQPEVDQPAPNRDGNGPPAERSQAPGNELRRRFDEAVVMLHARKYEFAIASLRRVLELSPRLPEAHVNMGYALLGLKEHRAARDYFLGALELNPRQANGYYGLAAAHEELGELPEALGAMRTYLHLADRDAKHLNKARAAIWEWEARISQKRRGGQGSAAHTSRRTPSNE